MQPSLSANALVDALLDASSAGANPSSSELLRLRTCDEGLTHPLDLAPKHGRPDSYVRVRDGQVRHRHSARAPQ